jgi:ribosome biogenesis GTPase
MRKLLDTYLASMGPGERRKLYKRAAKLRKAASAAKSTRRTRQEKHRWNRSSADWGDEPDTARVTPRQSRGGSLHDLALKILIEERAADEQAIDESEEPEGATGIERSGVVMAVGSGACTVLANGRETVCGLPRGLVEIRRSELAVGDSVSYAVQEGRDPTVTKVHPRNTTLSRPDPFIPERERLIACNIDAVLIVASVKLPPLQIRLIDRYMIAIQRGGSEPIVCVNKIDLLETEAERKALREKLEPYRQIGIGTFCVSASTQEGIEPLREAIQRRRCVLVGKSGVGKSSILNALAPDLHLLTREVSEATRKGKHTTTATVLYQLPGEIEIIDTPGIRVFGLWRIAKQDLQWYFPEFEEHTSGCRFTDRRATIRIAGSCRRWRTERGASLPFLINPRSALG